VQIEAVELGSVQVGAGMVSLGDDGASHCAHPAAQDDRHPRILSPRPSPPSFSG
jgi:hypothetical protein